MEGGGWKGEVEWGHKKGRQWEDCLPENIRLRGATEDRRDCFAVALLAMAVGLDVGLGLAEALDAVAGLPLAALFQDVDALEALEDVAFDDEAGGALETFVL
jgi:hypothetical protein